MPTSAQTTVDGSLFAATATDTTVEDNNFDEDDGPDEPQDEETSLPLPEGYSWREGRASDDKWYIEQTRAAYQGCLGISPGDIADLEAEAGKAMDNNRSPGEDLQDIGWTFVFVVETTLGAPCGHVATFPGLSRVYCNENPVTESDPRESQGFCAEVNCFVVDAEHRKKGIGRALITRCVEQAQTFGCQSVKLTTYPELESARKLCDKLGFRKQGERTARVYGTDLVHEEWELPLFSDRSSDAEYNTSVNSVERE